MELELVKRKISSLSNRINQMYLNSLSTERIQIFVPFDGPLVHRDIEVRDRSMIKNWLSYYVNDLKTHPHIVTQGG